MRGAGALLLLLTLSGCASRPSAEPVVSAHLELSSPSERWQLLDWSGRMLCELPCESKVVSGMKLEGAWSPWWSLSRRVTFVSIPSTIQEERRPVVLIPHARVGSPTGALALGISSFAVGSLGLLLAASSCNDHSTVDLGISTAGCAEGLGVAAVAGTALLGAIVWGMFSHPGYVEVRHAPGVGVHPATSEE
jgi:hypothetical protein